MLGVDGATCVSSQQLIEPVDTMIEKVQAGTNEGKNMKVPETAEHQQQPEVDPDLQQAVEVLKEKQEQKNLYTGLVIGLVTGVGILCLLVSIVNKYQYSLNRRPYPYPMTFFPGGYLGVATMQRGSWESGEFAQAKHPFCKRHLLPPSLSHCSYIRV